MMVVSLVLQLYYLLFLVVFSFAFAEILSYIPSISHPGLQPKDGVI